MKAYMGPLQLIYLKYRYSPFHFFNISLFGLFSLLHIYNNSNEHIVLILFHMRLFFLKYESGVMGQIM